MTGETLELLKFYENNPRAWLNKIQDQEVVKNILAQICNVENMTAKQLGIDSAEATKDRSSFNRLVTHLKYIAVVDILDEARRKVIEANYRACPPLEHNYSD